MARTPAPGTRERILSTAGRLFYEHGVRAVGMSRIVDEAGTGKNLLYTHFPTKDDLVAAYLERAGERRTAAARRAREAAGADPRDRLVAIVEEVASAVTSSAFRGCALRNYLTECPTDDDAAPARVARDFLAAARGAIRELVAELPPSPSRPADEELTEQLWLIVDGLYQQASYRRATDRHGAAADAGMGRAAGAAVALTRTLVAAG